VRRRSPALGTLARRWLAGELDAKVGAGGFAVVLFAA